MNEGGLTTMSSALSRVSGADRAGILGRLAEIQMQKAMGGPANFGTGGAGFSTAGLPHFQHGVTFRVGGTSGVDSKLLSMMVSPHEMVRVSPPAESAPEGIVIENHGATIEERRDTGGARRLIVTVENALARRARRGGPLGRTILDMGRVRRRGVNR